MRLLFDLLLKSTYIYIFMLCIVSYSCILIVYTIQIRMYVHTKEIFLTVHITCASMYVCTDKYVCMHLRMCVCMYI